MMQAEATAIAIAKNGVPGTPGAPGKVIYVTGPPGPPGMNGSATASATAVAVVEGTTTGKQCHQPCRLLRVIHSGSL